MPLTILNPSADSPHIPSRTINFFFRFLLNFLPPISHHNAYVRIVSAYLNHAIKVDLIRSIKLESREVSCYDVWIEWVLLGRLNDICSLWRRTSCMVMLALLVWLSRHLRTLWLSHTVLKDSEATTSFVRECVRGAFDNINTGVYSSVLCFKLKSNEFVDL